MDRLHAKTAAFATIMSLVAAAPSFAAPRVRLADRGGWSDIPAARNVERGGFRSDESYAVQARQKHAGGVGR